MNYEYWDISTGEPLNDDDLHDFYDEMLDSVYDEFMNLLPSNILKSTDPIAYRVGFWDWLDNELGATITDVAPDEEI